MWEEADAVKDAVLDLYSPGVALDFWLSSAGEFIRHAPILTDLISSNTDPPRRGRLVRAGPRAHQAHSLVCPHRAPPRLKRRNEAANPRRGHGTTARAQAAGCSNRLGGRGST